MNEHNLYAIPQADSAMNDSPEQPNRSQFRAHMYLFPAFLGAVIGSFVLAPYCRGPGDPAGHSIAAGLGGFAGLVLGILLHAFTRKA